MIFETKPFKKYNVSKSLDKIFGGKWSYVPFNGWYRDIDGAHICRTCRTDEFENVYFTGYYLYNHGSKFLGFNIHDFIYRKLNEKK